MSNNRYELEQISTPLVNRNTTRFLYVGTAKHGGDWNSVPHTHSCAEIFYVVGGVGQFKIEELTLQVEVDDIVVVNPGVEHTEVSLNASPLEYIVLGVEGLTFVAQEHGDDRYCVVNFRQERAHILHYLRSLLSEIEAREPGYDLVCQDLLEVLIVLLMRHRDFPLSPSTEKTKGSKECSTIRRYIDSHFKENLTLDFLAELSHVSKFHMVHSFSKQYGISPINYMIFLRIEESKHLLKDTDFSMSRIAQVLGFSSPSYFSQSFRRLEGVSPIEYRKNCREQNPAE